MGGVFSGLFGGQQPSIDVEEAEAAPAPSATVEPVSSAIRETEKRRLKARRAMAGTLLSGGKNGGSLDGSLLGGGSNQE